MEYAYYITHGRMLEERLVEQIKDFSKQNEDSLKKEILRRVSLASVLGVPIKIKDILNDVLLGSDAQEVLGSLCDEYVTIEDGFITGLHWVRSDHLAKILHNNYLEPLDTSLKILNTLTVEKISLFISNAFKYPQIDNERFFQELIDKAKKSSLRTILALLDGIYEAGEYNFYDLNKIHFDKAYGLLGKIGIGGLNLESLPIIAVSDSISIFSEMDQSGNWDKIKEISSRIDKSDRGLHWCERFLEGINDEIGANSLINDYGDLGKFLDWCYLCKKELTSWEEARKQVLDNNNYFKLSIDSFCWFFQGLYRFDEEAYTILVEQNVENFIGYLMFHLDCVNIEIQEKNLFIKYIVDLNEGNTNEQTMSRLRMFRAVYNTPQKLDNELSNNLRCIANF